MLSRLHTFTFNVRKDQIFRRMFPMIIHVEISIHYNDLFEDGKFKDTSIYKGTVFCSTCNRGAY